MGLNSPKIDQDTRNNVNIQIFKKYVFWNKICYCVKFEYLDYSLHVGQCLDYIDPLYHFGFLKVLWLHISNGFNGFFKLEELWSKRPVSFLPNKSLFKIRGNTLACYSMELYTSRPTYSYVAVHTKGFCSTLRIINHAPYHPVWQAGNKMNVNYFFCQEIAS